MEELAEYRQEIITALENTVDKLSKTAAGIAEDTWHSRIDPYSRTPHYILAHLLVLERQVFSIQLHRIVEEDHPLLPLFDDETWMRDHYDADIPSSLLLEEFGALRMQEVAWLCSMPAESWNCAGRHPWWGVRSLQWWVELQLDVSRQHLAELAAFLVK
jgi:hypothetical protein